MRGRFMFVGVVASGWCRSAHGVNQGWHGNTQRHKYMLIPPLMPQVAGFTKNY
ncbi:MAG: hypothetical protein IJR06_03550 [Paludibacteraceae bacterium]|nr:hypothetical protein [Paludibacteraceae bacterium]